MITSARRTFWFAIIIGVLVGVEACFVRSDLQPTVSAPAIRTSSSPALKPCVSSEFAVPESVMRAGQELVRLSKPFYRTLELGPQQYGWLSVHLDLIQDVVQYGEAIPLRLTITNGTDQPVIFVRPRNVEFLYYYSYPPFHPSFVPPTPAVPFYEGGLTSWHPYFPTQLYIDLVPFPDKIRPPEAIGGTRSPLLKEDFSMLRPGQSCTIEWKLTWNGPGIPLTGPIPPGDYTLKVFLRGTDLGPEIPGRPVITILDIGGWVGTSEASNPVTLTILPPD